MRISSACSSPTIVGNRAIGGAGLFGGSGGAAQGGGLYGACAIEVTSDDVTYSGIYYYT